MNSPTMCPHMAGNACPAKSNASTVEMGYHSQIARLTGEKNRALAALESLPGRIRLTMDRGNPDHTENKMKEYAALLVETMLEESFLLAGCARDPGGANA